MSFIDTFQKTVGPALISDPKFVWWSGAALVSSMLGRQVQTNTYVDTGQENDLIFGNIFVILVGQPGSGKTKALMEARAIANHVGVNVGPDDITGSRLYSVFKHNPKDPAAQPAIVSLFLDEFDSIMHSGQAAELKRTFNYFYDCRTANLQRQTVKHGEENLSDLCMSMVAGATPAHLNTAFTPNEWQEGFPSRLLFVWGECPDFRVNYSRGDMKWLKAEAERLQTFIGSQMVVPWHSQAMDAYLSTVKENWSVPGPHMLLGGYMNRRPLHLAKLSLILAMSNFHTQIEIGDYETALAKLTEIEADFNRCLQFAGGNDTKDVEIFLQKYLLDKKTVPEWQIRRFVGTRVSHRLVQGVIEELVASNILQPTGVNPSPKRIFKGGQFDG